MGNNYVNYHCHSSYSNVSTPDCTIKNEQRGKRVVELGQKVLSGLEHGFTGRFIEIYEYAKKNNLKSLYGVEAYYVKNRFEKDRTNSHIILLAKNEEGRKEINWILSEANVTGFYYKARIDQELLLSLNPKNVWVTSACLGGVWKYEDNEEIIKSWKEHFQDSLFLEVQYHHTDEQKDLNRKILKLSKLLNIKIIAGMDSHMIYPEQKKERDDYLLSRGIEYPEEQGWFLDFPTYETAKERFVVQGVLNEEKIVEALDNTNIFSSVEPYTSIIFDDTKIKLPTLHKDKTQEERNKILLDIIREEWKKEKVNVPENLHKQYEEEIKKEFSVIKETGMADYFIIDYYIVKKGKEMGGSITLTGRGSAPSYYVTKLLGLTTIDRIGATVKLFPERFISKARLLETMSLPDIDLNCGTPHIFEEAQKEVLGEGHSYKMIAFGTVKTLGAWKLYSRAAGVDFETSNHISEKLQEYENDLKHAEDEESISVYDYIDEKFHDIYNESKKYLGLVNTILPHPCAQLLYNEEDIRKEFGLIKIKTGNVEHICVNADGNFVEKYKMLKNDLLKVSVVDLIYRVYNRIGITPHPLPELIKMCNKDKDVWGIYEKALGMGINQVEQSGTIGRVAKYKPRNISELSAFIAAIRPGFKSNYKQFEARESFEYGIPSIDKLIQTEEFPQSYMLYQENAMQVLAYAGIPLSETYDIIKNISKKRMEKVYAYQNKFTTGMVDKIIQVEGYDKETAEKVAHNIWKIIEDSAYYSFNSSHAYSVAGDSLYGAYLKAKYPYEFYEVFLQMLEEDGDKDRLLKVKEEAQSAFGISFPNYQFGQDNRGIIADKENKLISSSLKSIKGFNTQIGEDLFEMSKNNYETFIDFLIQAEEDGKLSSKFEKLILIGYFNRFGKNKKLHKLWNEFKTGKNRYLKKLSDKSKEKRIIELKALESIVPNEELIFSEQIRADIEILGTIARAYPSIDKRVGYIIEINDSNGQYAPRLLVRSLNNGKVVSRKIQKKVFNKNPLNIGDVVYIEKSEKKNSVKYVGGEYVDQEGSYTVWMQDYYKIKNIDKLLTKEIK